VRKNQPAAYMKICALLVPREMKVEHAGGLKALSDEQLDQAIAALREMIAARAGEAANVIAPPLHLDCLATMPAEERRCFHALIAARDARRAWLHAKFKTLLRVRPQLKGWRAGPPGYDFYMPDEKYPTPPDCTRFLVDKLREWADRAEDGRPRGRRRRVFKPPPPRMPNDRFTALRNEISEILSPQPRSAVSLS
jgi:hypothetical protein